jgi:hypothetical protein
MFSVEIDVCFVPQADGSGIDVARTQAMPEPPGYASRNIFAHAIWDEARGSSIFEKTG